MKRENTSMETLPAMAPDRLSENFSPNASCTVDVHMAGSSKVLGYPVIPVLSKVDSKGRISLTSFRFHARCGVHPDHHIG